MKKKLFRAIGLMALTVIIAILALWPVTAMAHLTTDCVFQGPVTVDGISVPDGSVVTGWIDGVSGGPWSVSVYSEGITKYSLHIPVNTATGGNKNGGQDGDIVHFKVNAGGLEYAGIDGIFKSINNPYLPLAFSIQNIPQITTTSLPQGTVGVDGYSAILSAAGGVGPYTWTVTGLTNGLSLAAGTGAITGTPEPLPGDYGMFVKPALIAGYDPQFVATDTYGHSSLPKTIPLNIRWIRCDANGDGQVTIADVTKVELIILGMAAETPGADANQDGEVTIGDVTKIELNILGMDP